MFTRLRLPPFLPSGDWTKDGPNAVKWISDYLNSLEQKNALTIAQAQIYVDQGLQFPATQVASSDPNNLDDYEEVSTTPTPTAASGTFTTVSAAVTGTKVGNRFFYTVTVTITTNGTAADHILVPMPFTPAESTSCSGFDGTGLVALTGFVGTGGNMGIWKYDATYPGATGKTLRMSGSYRV